jgi:hypothetical protein
VLSPRSVPLSCPRSAAGMWVRFGGTGVCASAGWADVRTTVSRSARASPTCTAADLRGQRAGFLGWARLASERWVRTVRRW